MFGNRVRETTTTTGTGNLTLLGAATNYVTCNAKFGTNRRFEYWIEDDTNNAWENGIGYLSASTTLVRETVKDNSLGTTALINLGSGTKTVRASPGESMLIPALHAIRNPNALGKLLLPFNVGPNQGNSRAVTADAMLMRPVLYLQHGRVTTFRCYVGTAVAASKARIGLYQVAADGTPGSIIGESNDIDTTAVGMRSAAAIANFTVYPGWYYLAIVSSGAVAFSPFEDGLLQPALTPAGTTSSGISYVNLVDNLTAGWTALPATPAIDTTDSLRIPACFLEFT